MPERDLEGQVDHGERKREGEVEDERRDEAVCNVRAVGEVRRDDLARAVVGHGADERKDEHVDEADERDGLRDGLVVRPQVDGVEADGRGEGRRRLRDARDGRRVRAAEELGDALRPDLARDGAEVRRRQRHHVRARGELVARLRVHELDRLAPVVAGVSRRARAREVGRRALVDHHGGPRALLHNVVVQLGVGGELGRRGHKVAEAAVLVLREEEGRDGGADLGAVAVDDADGQLVGVVVGLPDWC